MLEEGGRMKEGRMRRREEKGGGKVREDEYRGIVSLCLVFHRGP
jgi:hypothetical protein